MILYKYMAVSFGSIDKMALVRTVRPFELTTQNGSAELLKRIETTIHLGFEDKKIDSLTLPLSSDESLGKTAFYLARQLTEGGLNVYTPDEHEAPELHEVILENRLNFDNAHTSLPAMLRTAEDYNLLSTAKGRTLGRSALIVVTSEPFMLSVASHQERQLGIPIADQTNDIPQGGVLPVNIELF